jgi:hypothetical protein
MEPCIAYCTAYPEDSAFGALHETFSYRLIGSCVANPEYDPGDMRKAILYALASSTDTTTPLLVVLVLLVWKDTSWCSVAIRSHLNLEALIQIPTGHMRFVLALKQKDGDISSLPPAKWLVEMVLISNKEGRGQFVCMERVNRLLAPVLRDTCQMSEDQLTFFPNSRTRGGPPNTPPSRPYLRDPCRSAQQRSPRPPLHLGP